MPRFKRGFKKRPYVGRHGRARFNATSAMNAASKALSVALQVKKLINVEFKAKDYGLSSQSMSTTGYIACINKTQEGIDGTDDFLGERIGDKVRWKSIAMKFKIAKSSTAATDAIYRILLVLDKAPKGIDTVVGDVLETDDIVSHRALKASKNIVILKEWTGIVTTDKPLRYIDYYRKLDMVSFYEGSAEAIPETNSLSLYLLSDRASGSNPPTLSGEIRLRYIDN